MAIGIFRKIGDFAKNVWDAGKRVASRLLPVASSNASAIPHPAAQAIGMGLNMANQTLGNLMSNTGGFNSAPAPSLPTLPGSSSGVSDLIKFSKV